MRGIKQCKSGTCLDMGGYFTIPFLFTALSKCLTTVGFQLLNISWPPLLFLLFHNLFLMGHDRLPREGLWYCMRKSGVAEMYVHMVEDV